MIRTFGSTLLRGRWSSLARTLAGEASCSEGVQSQTWNAVLLAFTRSIKKQAAQVPVLHEKQGSTLNSLGSGLRHPPWRSTPQTPCLHLASLPSPQLRAGDVVLSASGRPQRVTKFHWAHGTARAGGFVVLDLADLRSGARSSDKRRPDEQLELAEVEVRDMQVGGSGWVCWG